MKKRDRTAEQIIGKLREAEAELAEKGTIAQVCRKLEISKQTYYRWRNKYGQMGREEVRRLKHLEQENVRLKKMIAEQALDISLLKEVVKGKF